MGRTIPPRKICGEMSEWLKEHAWKVCKRVKPLRGFESRSLRQIFRFPLSGFRHAQWWPRRFSRDDSLQIPPGPEGSNGSERFGCRDVAGGAATFIFAFVREREDHEATIHGRTFHKRSSTTVLSGCNQPDSPSA